MTLYLNLATRQITSTAPSSPHLGNLTVNIPTDVDILSAIVESVQRMSVKDGYVSITLA